MAFHWRRPRVATWRQGSPAGRAPSVSVGYRRILVPLADTPASEKAMDMACRLAAEHHGSITAVIVIEIPPRLPIDAHMIEEEDEAHRLLDRVEAIGESYGVSMSTRILRARDAAIAIVDQVDLAKAEVVVIGGARKNRRSSHATIFERTVQDVLRKAPCRVMVIASAAETNAKAELPLASATAGYPSA